jgi:hypothetical protein
MKKVRKQGSGILGLVFALLMALPCMAQTVALTPGTITTIAGTGTKHEPTIGALAATNTIEPVYAVAVAPMIYNSVTQTYTGGDIYFSESTSYVYVIYEGGAAAEAIILANAANNGGVTSSTITIGDIYLIAGTGTAGTTAGNDTTSLSSSAKVVFPRGLAVDSYGNLFMAQSSTTAGISSVQAVYAGVVTGQNATNPLAALITLENTTITSPVAGYLYNIAGVSSTANGNDINSGIAWKVLMTDICGIYVDSSEDVYIANSTGYLTLPDTVAVVYAGGSNVKSLLQTEGYTTLALGDGYMLAGGESVTTYPNDNGDSSVAFKGAGTNAAGTSQSAVNAPYGVGINPTTNDVLITESGANKIRKLSGTTGVISTVLGPASGTAATAGGVGDGTLAAGTTAEVNAPQGMWVDAGGNIYFADTKNNVIRKMDANGYVSTIAGTMGTASTTATAANGDGGNATAATLNAPYDVKLDANGNLIIADEGNNKIRKVTVNASTAGSVIATAVNNSGVFSYEGNFAFGSEVAGSTTTAPATALISNLTAAAVTPTISIPTGFVQSPLGNTDAPDCSNSTQIPAGTSCTLALEFSPTTAVAYSPNATVTVGTDTVTIPVTGTGTSGLTTTSTNLAISPSSAPYYFGNSITFTSTVTAGATGNVVFTDNGTTTLATVAISGTTATYTTSSLALGSHSVTAAYQGNSSYASSTSSAQTFTITVSPLTNSTTTVTPSTTAPNMGAIVTLSVSVTGTTSPVPSGTVVLTDSINGVTITLGTVTLNNGSGSLQTSSLNLGNNVISGAYSGDSKNNPSTSSSVTVTVSTLQASAIPGVITTVIGTGTAGTTGNGGLATSATLTAPYVARSDASGDIYVSDNSNEVRVVNAITRDISLFAGTGTSGYAGDGGPATAAEIEAARGLAIDAAGDVYISDTGNNVVRVVYEGGSATASLITLENPTVTTPVVGDIYTIAGGGTGATNTLATNQALSSPRGVLVDSYGNVFIADLSSNKVRVIYVAGSAVASLITLENTPTVTTPVVGDMYVLAGNGTGGYSGDGGLATSAEIYNPADIGFDPSGNLYLTEYNGNRVRKVAATTGYISTIAGSHSGTAGFTGDGGAATAAELNGPRGIWVDYAGDVYIADSSNNRIRKIDGSGNINTIAGGGTAEGDTGAATSALVDVPHSVAFDNLGNLIIATNSDNRVRSVNVSSAQLAFSNVAVNATSTLQATIANIGQTTMTLSNISIPTGFTQTTSSSGTSCTSTTILTAGLSCILQVTFAPTATGTASGTALVTSNAAALSIALSGTGVQAATTTTLTANPTTPNFAQSVTLTATVTATSGTPTGTVTFYDGTNVLASGVQLSSGVATFTTSSLAAVSHNLSAVYSGAAAFASSTGTLTLNVTNNAVASTTVLTSSSSSPSYEQSVTLTATVTSSGAQPTGTVTFYANSIILLGSSSLSNGVATLATTILPVGSDSLTAVYSGDSNNFPSTSQPVTVTVSVLQLSVIPGTITTVIGTGTAGTTGNGGLATSATINAPYVARSDASGDIYVSDNSNEVRVVNASTKDISLFAGTGTAGYTGDKGPASSAEISAARGLAIDAAGDVYISDTGNNVIRVVYEGGAETAAILNAEGVTTPTVGDIYTIAGNGSGANNTLATNQAISSPRGVLVDSYGNIFFADLSNDRVRVIYASGSAPASAAANLIELEYPGTTPAVGYMYVIAGSGSGTYGGDGALAIAAGIASPADIGLDPSGNLYLTEFNGNRVRKVSATNGFISTVAGSSGKAGFTGDGAAATAAELDAPRGIWVDYGSNIYIADSANNRIRKIDGSGNINTIAGGGTVEGDGGAAISALVNAPHSVAFDNFGNLLIATNGDNRVRSVNVSNAQLVFPSTLLNATSTLQAIISNIGQTTVALSGISLPTGFTQTTPSSGTNCTTTTSLTAGQSCILQVAFTPTTATSFSGTATITSNAATLSIALSGTGVTVLSTSTALTASTTSATYGQNITFTATVTSASGTPTGSVTFYNGSTAISGTQSLNGSGVATFSISTLATGSYSITANYSGGIDFAASISPVVNVSVIGAGYTSTTVLSASPVAATLGQSVAITATVTSSGTGSPTGSVNFYDNGLLLGSAQLVNGVGTYNTSTLVVGAHSITGYYFGDPNNLPSTPASISITVSVLQISAIPGVITTVVGTGVSGTAGNGGPATSATLTSPFGVRSDASGNLYITDDSNLIRMVSASTGFISTIAGTGTASFSGDGGPATAATINGAHGIAVDASGNVYIADTGNNRIRMIFNGGAAATAILAAEGVSPPVIGSIYTIAGGGTGSSKTLATNQALASPRGVFVDAYGNVYIPDFSKNYVRAIYASGSAAANLITLENPTVTSPVVGDMYILAGNGSGTYSGDGALAISAGVDEPYDIGFDSSGNLYLTENGGNRIRVISAATGFISTLAGSHSGTAGYTGDGGPATAATLDSPRGIWVDDGGNVYIADEINNVVRMINGSGIISTIAGGGSSTGDNGAATAALVSEPFDVAFDNQGNLLIATDGDNRIRSVSASSALLAFPNTTIGKTAVAQTIVLANTGGLPILPSAFSIPAGFTQVTGAATDCGIATPIAAGGSCNLRISFSATKLGYSGGSATITTNAGNAPQGVLSVQLSALSSNANTVSTKTTLVTNPSNGAVDLGQTLTLTATVVSTGKGGFNVPTGTVTFQSGTTILGTVTLPQSGIATLAVSTLPLGTSIVTAVYSGDTVYQSSIAGSVTATVYNSAGDFALALPTSTSTNPNPGFILVTTGQTATYILTVSAFGGFDQTITFSCSNLPANASCVFSPTYLTPVIGASDESFALAISTSASNAPNGPHAGLGIGAPLGRIVAPLLALLLGVPFLPMRLRRRLRGVLLLLLLSICSAGVFTGCSNTANYTTAYAPPGIYTVTITGVAGTYSHSTNVVLDIVQ